MTYTPPSSPIFLAGRIDLGRCLSAGLAQSHFCTLQMSTQVMAKSWGKPSVFRNDRDPMFGNGLVMVEGRLRFHFCLQDNNGLMENKTNFRLSN
ncbi:hypothetical protein L6164_000692 [Bauhinia variegata]|uniref:Uncharacterized protein n=1 Tax=Bauhinia variegata TaxID=167791 RepID=A0ACB9Q9B8_BAUVA|nr:hypothetical protein L6164_000692 [Bauhinia variegata]